MKGAPIWGWGWALLIGSSCFFLLLLLSLLLLQAPTSLCRLQPWESQEANPASDLAKLLGPTPFTPYVFPRDFPGGPVAQTVCSQCRGPGIQSLVREQDPTSHKPFHLEPCYILSVEATEALFLVEGQDFRPSEPNPCVLYL